MCSVNSSQTSGCNTDYLFPFTVQFIQHMTAWSWENQCTLSPHFYWVRKKKTDLMLFVSPVSWRRHGAASPLARWLFIQQHSIKLTQGLLSQGAPLCFKSDWQQRSHNQWDYLHHARLDGAKNTQYQLFWHYDGYITTVMGRINWGTCETETLKTLNAPCQADLICVRQTSYDHLQFFACFGSFTSTQCWEWLKTQHFLKMAPKMELSDVV